MKKLTLLLTSFLLVGVASANNSTEATVSVTITSPVLPTSVTATVSVAPPLMTIEEACGDLSTLEESGELFSRQCVSLCNQKGKIYIYGEGCRECPAGTVIEHNSINKCVEAAPEPQQPAVSVTVAPPPLEPSSETCDRWGQVYNAEQNVCETCPDELPYVVKGGCSKCPHDYSWQEVHNRCFSFTKLGLYCDHAHGQVYDPKTDACEVSCPKDKAPDNYRVCRDL